MLARAPQTLLNFDGIPRHSRRLLLLRHRRSTATTCSAAATVPGGGSRGWKVSAAYKRIPMETSGAYQLIDEETGDKFIVWGGAENGPDSPIPSAEVLSWRPPRKGGTGIGNEERPRKGVEATAPVAEIGCKPTASVGGSTGGFGRLKAPKVKALMKKSSQRNSKENAPSNRILGPDDADRMDSSEFRNAETSLGSLQPKESNDSVLTDEKVGNTNSVHFISRKDARDEEVDVSVPRIVSSSRGWGGAASLQSAAAGQLKRHRKASTDGGFFSRKSFKDLGCTDVMIESLRGQMFLRPSHIQAMAYGPVLEGKSCIIADQSGSGKTLAYLAPIIQNLRQEEVLGLGKSLSRSPRVVILVPTAELASQVLNNCRAVAKFGVPFRSMAATGGFRQKTQLENLEQELDVLIATPGRFIYLLHEGHLQLTNLKCVVLDEADILFGDDEFEQVLQSLISSAPMSAQYLFVTATLPVDIYNKLVEVFPDCQVIMGPGMHRTSSGLEEFLVDCSGDDGEEKNPDTAFQNKKSALLQLVEESSVPKTIVFCNKIETCRKVENVLQRFDRKGLHIKVLPFHAALSQEIRLSNMKEFLDSQSKESMFLICTDRASRGIDFANVDHVILFDFPRDPSEYVRRVGRTARGAGGKGKAYIFVVGKQVSLARRIMERNRKGHPLHHVPCAYELEKSAL
ncbi:DEAD-box ATP-dependent RNA helicase 50 isoform X2 [Phoenix dactylifera]|uniref:DEAD-box ATP-dependent RNA helicase 50 isoform X2 n=1 Tax=Phoenix dactylifera TaxID=42345 RepID=A0A8B8ZXB6_PHODC|nr:DEAD-box ATP-dependent RNA helicase 50 isoform X2 [Phoenix dactylifera]